MSFKTKKEFEQWAFNLFDKYGIRHPDTYSEQEKAEACPNVPTKGDLWQKKESLNSQTEMKLKK